MRVATIGSAALAALAAFPSLATAAAAGHADHTDPISHAQTRQTHGKQYTKDKKMLNARSVSVVFEPEPGICFTACYLPLNYVQWGDMDTSDTYWGMKIGSRAWMTSLVACMSHYCSDEQAAAGWDRFALYLRLTHTETALPDYAVVLEEVLDIEVVPLVDCLGESKGKVFNETILSTHENFENGWHTDEAMERQMFLHNAYGASMFVLLGAMVLVGMLNRLGAYMASRRAKDVEGGSGGGYISLSSTKDSGSGGDLYTWYKKHIGTPAVGGYRHLQPAWWGFISLPTRLEACIISVYVGINILLSVVQYDLFYDNLYWYAALDIQLARYVADRTGIMCFYNLVLLWALAGRNDVVIWLTGWSYQSMNLFHRWAARVATLQAIVHSIGYGYIQWGLLWESMAMLYWAVGVFATVAMSVLLLVSVRPLRVKAYETFLALHIALSAAVLVLLYYHVDQFGYEAWIFICAGLWAFDRLIRIARVMLLSTKALNAPNATASLTSADGLIRLSVDTALPISPRPGDYYFLYEPLSLTPWENHPFTLASAEPLPGKVGGVRLHFLIMPLAGWTGRLLQSIETQGGEKAEMRVLLEGPYGHQADVSSFDHVLLVAGGSGIAAVLPYLATLPGRRVTLVWTVRNAVYAADVFAHELASVVRDVPVELFVTRQDAATALSVLGDTARVGNVDANATAENRTAPGVHVMSGRPDMHHLVRAALDSLLGGERLAVLACGPGVMLDDLRVAVADSYGSGKGQVDGTTLHYFEEAFVW